MSAIKYCCLEDDKICIDCGECLICDIYPQKVCDNCGKCIENDADYSGYIVDEVIIDEDKLSETIVAMMDEEQKNSKEQKDLK